MYNGFTLFICKKEVWGPLGQGLGYIVLCIFNGC